MNEKYLVNGTTGERKEDILFKGDGRGRAGAGGGGGRGEGHLNLCSKYKRNITIVGGVHALIRSPSAVLKEGGGVVLKGGGEGGGGITSSLDRINVDSVETFTIGLMVPGLGDGVGDDEGGSVWEKLVIDK